MPRRLSRARSSRYFMDCAPFVESGRWIGGVSQRTLCAVYSSNARFVIKAHTTKGTRPQPKSGTLAAMTRTRPKAVRAIPITRD